MSYKIILDSCGELTEKLKGMDNVERVPLTLEVGEYSVQDDDNFNQAEFLKQVASHSECAKSSCPSPERYMQAFDTDADRVYAVTLSANLSGSYNSAELGRTMYLEKYGHKDIVIVDSHSASIGETNIMLKAVELEKQGLPFEKIKEELFAYRDAMNTYFVLDNLETLRKNGRLTGVKALVASTLSIKPVMGATKEGTIVQLGQSVGMKKALKKMVDHIMQDVVQPEEKRVLISHCNAPDRAELVKSMILERAKFKEIEVVDTAGVSTMYANDGGVIVAL